jgi:hypothetical protein
MRQRPVEPSANPQLMLDLSDNPVPLSGDHLIGKPNRPVSSRCEPGIPFPILLRMVERTIQFDNQLRRVTAKVRHKPAYRDLATEVQTMVPA